MAGTPEEVAKVKASYTGQYLAEALKRHADRHGGARKLKAAAAEALIDQGADIIMQHTDSTAALTVAQERGAMAFGQASDMTQFAPDVHLTAIIDNWAPYYIDRIQARMDGTWESTNSWNGIAQNEVTFAPFNDRIPAEVQDEANAMIEAIRTEYPRRGLPVSQLYFDSFDYAPDVLQRLAPP